MIGGGGWRVGCVIRVCVKVVGIGNDSYGYGNIGLI